MAIDAPNGFTPFGHLIGSVTAELSQVKYGFASAYATSIFRGDLVSLVAAGTIVRSSESMTISWGRLPASSMWMLAAAKFSATCGRVPLWAAKSRR